MEEANRIKSLFAKQFDGKPWLGVNFTEKLQEVTPEMAAYKITPDTNSIWEILNHIIGWREVVLQGFPQNGYITPSHNYLHPVENTSYLEWEHTLVRLKDSQQDWTEFFETLDESIFDQPFGDKPYTYYELMLGILHHDIYHLGQISLLIKLIPKRLK
ncbi:DinB family protein [Algoriphagus machipongonensis]|uniref:DinB-like domain-containing protein n=1 Tax=Algoriphagus machipongonensis TaxID=388413 RepID=A3HTN7_9BACT|nr:DinB family protein [Algoriphagus machipongonensis]EAZ83205.1 hypothetical protein ALPR1_13330 [Algoriphagus machipongonensis]